VELETASTEAWRRIEEAELAISSVSAGTGFGRSSGLRVSAKIYAIHNDGGLVLKLPSARVQELIATGDAAAWGPGTGKTMKEWVAISPAVIEDWPTLVAEARTFVGDLARRDETRRPAPDVSPRR
jgi:hypothetical protein